MSNVNKGLLNLSDNYMACKDVRLVAKNLELGLEKLLPSQKTFEDLELRSTLWHLFCKHRQKISLILRVCNK